MALERMGNLKFKVIAYRKLQEIINAGALGCELRLTGKLPSERAKSWRFAEGYLKKAGEPRKEVDRAQATALTKTGIIGIKVAIMSPDAKIYDKIEIDDKLKAQIKNFKIEEEETEKPKPKKIKKPKTSEKQVKINKEKNKLKSNTKIKEKVIKETKINPEEGGTAIKTEEETKEGVPQDMIDKEIKEKLERKNNKAEKSSNEVKK